MEKNNFEEIENEILKKHNELRPNPQSFIIN